MRRHKIAVIPGDGIGKEVIPAGISVLRALEKRCGDFELVVYEFPWGSDYYRQTGRMMPEDGLEILRSYDAIYFGAVGDPRPARRCDAVGPAAENLPGLRSVRQCPADARFAGNRFASARMWTRAISTG